MRRVDAESKRVGLIVGAIGSATCLAGLCALAAGTPVSLAQATTDTSARAAAACTVHADKVAAPGVLVLGETVDITLTVKATCQVESPLHIVLVLDASSSMAGEPSRPMKEAAVRFVRKLDMAIHRDTMVGVVQFNSSATKLCELTNDAGRVEGCIRRIGADGGSAIDAGIREGLKVLLRGRSDFSSRDVRQVMVVLADGDNNAGCPPVLQAANQAKGSGVLLATVCVGPGCDAPCLQAAATSAGHFFHAQVEGDLMRVFERVYEEIVGVGLRRLTVVDTLPDNMRLVPNSALPAPKDFSPNGDQIEWEANFVPRTGLTMTFRVEPLQPGRWPTNVEATGDYVDNSGERGSLVFPVPVVVALMPGPLTPPIGPPPTPTDTPRPPTATTVPPTATPTPTRTPVPGRVWLPSVERS